MFSSPGISTTRWSLSKTHSRIHYLFVDFPEVRTTHCLTDLPTTPPEL